MPIGSNFDDFLEKEGIREECELEANKQVISWRLQQAMKEYV
jgi:hypothetical protein